MAGRKFLIAVQRFKAQIRLPIPRGVRNSARRLSQAERYCALYGIAACLGIWLFNRGKLGKAFNTGRWLEAVLQRELAAECRDGSLEPALASALFEHMDGQRKRDEMFSIMNWPLAKKDQAEHIRRVDFPKEYRDEPQPH